MRPEIRPPLIVFSAALILFFTCLGGSYLWDEDEPKNAECAREMFEANNWIVPQFNYQLRTDKPILLYWLMLTSYQVFGVNEFAARFWSAALAVGTTMLTYRLGVILYGPRVGLWSGLALASCLMFGASGRAATPDSTLTFFTTLALYCFVRFGGVERSSLPRSGAVAMYVAMSSAVLAKGPVGFVLPGGVLGLFLLCRSRQAEVAAAPSAAEVTWFGRLCRAATTIAAALSPRRLIAAVRTLHPLVGLAVLAVVALPWYVLVGVRTDGAWLAGFLGQHNFARFTTAMETHGGPVYYYVVAVLAGYFPWSCFLPLAAYRLVGRLGSAAESSTRAADTLLACWSGAYLVFFTIARTKLPSYVLPCYPALAIMTAVLLEEFVTRTEVVPRLWFRWAVYTSGLVGVATICGFPIVAYFLELHAWWVGVFGLSLVCGSIGAVWALRSRREWVPACLAVAAVVFVTSMTAFAAGVISQQSSTPQLLAAAREAAGRDVPIIGFRHGDPTLNFYSRREVPIVDGADDLAAALRRLPGACIVTRDPFLPDVVAALGGDAQVLLQRRRFLRPKGNVILILPTDAATARRDASLVR